MTLLNFLLLVSISALAGFFFGTMVSSVKDPATMDHSSCMCQHCPYNPQVPTDTMM